MNCDQAFDALTDPTRRDSDELNRHLKHCARCRQMQDVLAPALGLLTHAPRDSRHGITDDAGLELDREPATHPATLTAEAILIAERTAAELTRQRRSDTPSGRLLGSSLLRYAAVFLLGVGITVGVSALGGDRRPAAAAAAGTSADCLWVQHRAQPRPDFDVPTQIVVASCVGCHHSDSIQQ